MPEPDDKECTIHIINIYIYSRKVLNIQDGNNIEINWRNGK